MFEFFFGQSSDEKPTSSAMKQFEEGVEHLKAKFYKRAMLEFYKALKMDPDQVSKELEGLLKKYKVTANYDATLSIGLVLLKYHKRDFRLLTMLGNCARRGEHYSQANNLYRHALKINPDYQIAMLNLAASLAKIPVYDGRIQPLILKYVKNNELNLPEYQHDPQFIDKLRVRLKEQAEEASLNKMQELLDKLEEIKAKNNLLELHAINLEIAQEEKRTTDPKDEDIIAVIQDMIRDYEDDPNNAEQIKYHELCFNLGLFALKTKNATLALSSFNTLKAEGLDVEDLDMLIAIAHAYNDNFEECRKTFHEILRDSPTHRVANLNLGILYRLKNNELMALKHLITASYYLEKSGGMFRLGDLFKKGEEYYEEENYKPAFKCFTVVTREKPDPLAWWYIGKIHFALNKYEAAVEAFQKIYEITPDSELAKEELNTLHNIYFERAEEALKEGKYKVSSVMFEKALAIDRQPETLKRASAVFRLLRENKRANELQEEYNKLKSEEENEKMEVLRQEYIQSGKEAFKKKDFHRAIEKFELAFRMKVDKNVFVFLATIYKTLKRQRALEDLLKRWNKMVEYEEKMEQEKKDMEKQKLKAELEKAKQEEYVR